MIRLVDDLLDVSRITRDKLQLRKTRVDLASIIRHAVEASRPLAERDQQTIEVVLPDQPVYLDADPVRLTQVFSNLFNNACQYRTRRTHLAHGRAAESRSGPCGQGQRYRDAGRSTRWNLRDVRAGR